MSKQLHSIGGIVYHIWYDNQPRFLIIKRHARSKKIEWVAPKWKSEPNETPQQTCLREIYEEAWIDSWYLHVESQLGTVTIKNINFWHWYHEKDVTYYLVRHNGPIDQVHIQAVEWFIGVYKRATIQDITGLIIYPSMRDIFRKAYSLIQSTWSNTSSSSY